MKKWKKTTRARRRVRTLSTPARESQASREKASRAVNADKAKGFKAWVVAKEAAYRAWRKEITEGVKRGKEEAAGRAGVEPVL